LFLTWKCSLYLCRQEVIRQTFKNLEGEKADMDQERLILAAGILLLLVIAGVVIHFAFSSTAFQRHFTVMGKLQCNGDGICEAGEESCQDCANLAGKSALITVPSTGFDTRIFFALIAVVAIIILELSVLARRT
jgi:hypothetical protein